jgi:hypothetical protein
MRNVYRRGHRDSEQSAEKTMGIVRHENYTLFNRRNLLDCCNPDKELPEGCAGLPLLHLLDVEPIETSSRFYRSTR